MVELTQWRNGLLNELLLTAASELTWQEALAQIEARLDEARTTLLGRGAQLTLDLSGRTLASEDLESLVYAVRDKYGLLAVALITTDLPTQEAARRLGLTVYQMLPGGSVALPESEAAAGNNALYLPGTVRSGQRIVHGGHVIVMGDVNAGAEVIASGDVIVFGALRGLAHAGSQGDERARIIAGHMRPQQLRIGALIARAPEEKERIDPANRRTEVARVEEGAIQVSLL